MENNKIVHYQLLFRFGKKGNDYFHVDALPLELEPATIAEADALSSWLDLGWGILTMGGDNVLLQNCATFDAEGNFLHQGY